MKIYGPVPSRRLGRSLGINNIPAKRCTYSCIYCQLGRTINVQVERETFFVTEKLVTEAKEKARETQEAGEKIDYLSFVPDGEPTLDKELGLKIEHLQPLEIDLAVISNGSLLWQDKVRSDLSKADWVSVKVDAASKKVWRKVNRPHKSLNLKRIKEGIRNFSKSFAGTLATETMLIENINDGAQEAERIANFIQELHADISYLAIPTRPPAEDWANPTTESRLARNYDIFNNRLEKVEYLIGYEGNEFSSTGNVKDDLLSITAVHPMREEGVQELLQKAGSKWNIVEELLEEEELKEVNYGGNNFYLRKLPNQ
ncbi:radical SAM protein [Candidatus Bipolaricaulota bacterium]|nr:radical SAM protein [Candidatus Bipolaricaulota bacterium]